MPDKGTTTIPVLDRLLMRTEKTPSCWLWQGATDKDGYGLVTLGGLLKRVHRVAWETSSGSPLAFRQPVGHTCDIPGCWRNDDIGTYEVDGVTYERRGHFWLATLAANAADMASKSRGAMGDQNGSRLYPERLKRGDENSSRLHPELLMRGERVNTAKLTADQVVEIRARRAKGESARLLAAEFHVHKNLIWLIAQGKVWKHV